MKIQPINAFSPSPLLEGKEMSTLLEKLKSSGKTEEPESILSKLRQKESDFNRVMEQIKNSGETYDERRERIETSQKKADKKRAAESKANKLRSKIVHLRSRAMANRHDKTVRGELSYAKTQLYWANNPMSSENS